MVHACVAHFDGDDYLQADGGCSRRFRGRADAEVGCYGRALVFARANVDDGCYVLLGLMYPEDGMKKLRQMEMQTGIWTMRVQLMIDGRDIVVIDRQTSVRTRLVRVHVHRRSQRQ